jgi:LacI family transcriptional regulator
MGELIRAIEDELMDTPYDLLILNMRMKRVLSKFFRETMNLTKKIDALIISSATIDDESVEYFRSLNIPVVLLQSRCPQEKSISTNNYQGALDAVNFMITRGYNKIGFIGWEPEDDHLVDRFHGYKNAIEKANLGFQSEMTAFSSLSVEGGYEATARLFEHVAPDGVFYACDSMAYGGYRYFLEKEIRIPADIGIVGFDDLEFSSVLGLTTMKQYIQNKVKIAISYLLDRVAGTIETPSNEEISITPKLVIRNSIK